MANRPPRYLQPFLHDLVTCLAAPVTVLSGADGQLRAEGAQGLLIAEVRHLSELVVEVDGRPPTGLGHQQVSAAEALFVGVVRDLGDRIADATVRVERRRRVDSQALREALVVVNDGRSEVRAAMTVRLASDLASVVAVKEGRPNEVVTPRRVSSSVIEWSRDSCRTTVSVDRPPDEVEWAEDHVVLRWELNLASRDRAQVTLDVSGHADPAGDAVFEAPGARPT